MANKLDPIDLKQSLLLHLDELSNQNIRICITSPLISQIHGGFNLYMRNANMESNLGTMTFTGSMDVKGCQFRGLGEDELILPLEMKFNKNSTPHFNVPSEFVPAFEIRLVKIRDYYGCEWRQVV